MTVPEPLSGGPGPRGRALFLFYWLPVLGYAAFILVLSSIPGSRVPSPFPFVDKLAHLLEYSLFGLLVGRAIRFTWGGSGRIVVILTAIGIGAAMGLLDELYQGTVSGRTTDAADWLVDVLAVSAAVALTQIVPARPLRDGIQE
ncbi:MAG TPA: VanZ family protein [Candidatus Eisenbacteria bacterium]|nr:VanZ family protein [Candidatus Eisenbacteria bacterium]